MADIPLDDSKRLGGPGPHESAANQCSPADEYWQQAYKQLRAAAQQHLLHERSDHTLTATALVHEAYLRLVGPRRISWQNQAHFYAAAAEAIRHVLLDYAKSHRALKRGGSKPLSILSTTSLADLAAPEKSAEILAFDEAFCRLEAESPEAARVVRLRFFAGLDVQETARLMNLSPRTVDRRWSFAKAWLHRQLRDGNE